MEFANLKIPQQYQQFTTTTIKPLLVPYKQEKVYIFISEHLFSVPTYNVRFLEDKN